MGTNVHVDQVGTLLPIPLFGSILWFRKFCSCEHPILDIHEHFPKQSFRNRYEIPTANGLLSLTIPIKKINGNKTPYSDILIDRGNWRDLHWRSIASAYGSSPYFEHYSDDIERLIYQETELLVHFNLSILDKFIEWLELPVRYELSKSFVPYTDSDLRLTSLSKHLQSPRSNPPYIQCFDPGVSFNERISLLDGLLCDGPLIRNLLIK